MSIAHDLFALVTGCAMPSKQEQERRWAREAMEALCGEERCALACAPKQEPPTDAELNHWSALLAEEAIAEGRRHRPFPLNPHDE